MQNQYFSHRLSLQGNIGTPTKKTRLAQPQSAQQVAKIDLIQLSNNQYFQNDATDQKFIDFNILNTQQNHVNHPTHNNGNKFRMQQFYEDDKDKVLGKLRKFTQQLAQIGKDRSTRTDRSYRMTDRSFSITMRSPISTSNYIATGTTFTKNTQKSLHQNPLISQYITRQQRNMQRLRRYQNNTQQHTQKYNQQIHTLHKDINNSTGNGFIFKTKQKQHILEVEKGNEGCEFKERVIGTANGFRVKQGRGVRNVNHMQDCNRDKAMQLLAFIDDKQKPKFHN